VLELAVGLAAGIMSGSGGGGVGDVLLVVSCVMDMEAAVEVEGAVVSSL